MFPLKLKIRIAIYLLMAVSLGVVSVNSCNKIVKIHNKFKIEKSLRELKSIKYVKNC